MVSKYKNHIHKSLIFISLYYYIWFYGLLYRKERERKKREKKGGCKNNKKRVGERILGNKTIKPYLRCNLLVNSRLVSIWFLWF